jgi:Undecaprenyl-phosphate galactose phosphotransferase WbaP
MRSGWLKFALPVADLLMLAASLVLGALVAKAVSPYWTDVGPHQFLGWLGVRSRVAVPLWLLLMAYFYANGHYTRRIPWGMQAYTLVTALGFAFMSDGFISYAMKAQISRVWLAAMWSSAFPLLLLGRQVVRAVAVRTGAWALPTVVVGSGRTLEQTLFALHSDRFALYDVRLIVCLEGDECMPQRPKRYENAPAVCQLPAVEPYFELQEGWLLVMCPSTWGDPTLAKLAAHARANPSSQLAVVPPVGGLSLYSMEANYFFGHDVVLLSQTGGVESPVNRVLKRVLDVGGALGSMVVLGPLIAALAWKVKRDGGPAFYGHERVGKDGRSFKCWKLRSMVPNAEQVLEELLARDPEAKAEWERDFKLKDDPRVTRIGHVLRRYSLDELPQLWNVLRGEMSLVGPRPIVEAELKYYGDRVEDYYASKPGLTGLWQVSGRNDVSYEYRVHLDCWYAQNWSLWSDIIILLKTVRVVLAREGAY